MSWSRLGWGLAGALAVLSGALTAASCGDDEPVFPDEGGGGTGGQVADGGQGGTAGEGGTPPSCDEGCSEALPICLDGECAAFCPIARERCDTELDAEAADVCCALGEQCCPAAEYGYPADLCRPAGEACPFLCADGTTLCAGDEQCLYDPATDSYGCTDTCQTERSCGDTCCPLGSRCDAGQCPLPNLGIDVPGVTASIAFEDEFFATGACEKIEGCIGSTGVRRLLRFSLGTPNSGAGDLFMGPPSENTELFEYSDCHGHYHFTSYADYRLLTESGTEVATGHKQAFCLLDSTPIDPMGDPFDWVYDCDYQGIQKGWADVYTSDLPCQWVDITGVAPGNYMLEITLNQDKVLAESDYSDDMAMVPVTVP